MSTSRIVLLYGAWLLAAGSVAVTLAVIVTEMLVVVGLVDRSSGAYGSSIGATTALLFIGIALVPFVFRRRFVVPSPEEVEER